MAIEETRSRVLMFPWLGYGHISPFLELAKKLSKKNFYIYFCSTPINLKSIKNKFSSENHLISSIELLEFHLPTSDELPPHYHTTNGLPPHLHKTLHQAFEMAIPNFSEILKNLKPDLVIFDIFQPWVPELASSYHIPAVHFKCSGAASSSFFLSGFKLQGKGELPFPSSAICLRPPEIKKMLARAPVNTDPRAVEDPIFTCLERSVDFVLLKSSRSIEEKYIDFFSVLTKKKMLTVGTLTYDGEKLEEEKDDMEIMKWLSKREKSSTVFVSFGSENYLSKKQMEELAYGLELSNVNFIWVIRFPSGDDDKVKIEEVLPKGFIWRVKDRGMVVEGWAPQTKILGHESTGGFVSHCGWSSVTESLSFGVPIIGIPLNFDQPLNARLVTEIGVGLEVMKDEDLEFGREEVARVLNEVMVEKSGEEMRRKVKELCENIRMKEEEEMCVVVEELKKLCNKN